MPTWTIRIDMPPKGDLEQGGAGAELTQEDMDEEAGFRMDFVDHLREKVQALLSRPPRRAANVERVELRGANQWGRMNHYLLDVTVDVGGPGFDPRELAPPGADVAVIGDYVELESWGRSRSR